MKKILIVLIVMGTFLLPLHAAEGFVQVGSRDEQVYETDRGTIITVNTILEGTGHSFELFGDKFIQYWKDETITITVVIVVSALGTRVDRVYDIWFILDIIGIDILTKPVSEFTESGTQETLSFMTNELKETSFWVGWIEGRTELVSVRHDFAFTEGIQLSQDIGWEYSSEETVSFFVYNPKPPILSLSYDYTIEDPPLNPGDQVSISIAVENKGDQTAENVEVYLVSNEEAQGLPGHDRIGDLDRYVEKLVHFAFTPQNYGEINLDIRITADNHETMNDPISLQVVSETTLSGTETLPHTTPDSPISTIVHYQQSDDQFTLTPFLAIILGILLGGPVSYYLNHHRRKKEREMIQQQYCTRCSSKFPSDAVFCPYCALKIKREPPTPPEEAEETPTEEETPEEEQPEEPEKRQTIRFPPGTEPTPEEREKATKEAEKRVKDALEKQKERREKKEDEEND